jgi:small subunit ribosomal protein S1
VTIARLRAFCPQSQIDTVRDADPTSHLGQVYEFRIIELATTAASSSCRAAPCSKQNRKSARRESARARAGAVVTGRVVSVREFGAFVDLGGGVQGLLHVSEMGWSRVDDPSQMLKPATRSP